MGRRRMGRMRRRKLRRRIDKYDNNDDDIVRQSERLAGRTTRCSL